MATDECNGIMLLSYALRPCLPYCIGRCYFLIMGWQWSQTQTTHHPFVFILLDSQFNRGIYDIHLELKKVPILEWNPDISTVRDI